MQVEVIDKATGTTTQVPLERIALNAPSVVRLEIDRAQVASMQQQGDDLLLRLQDGQTIVVDGFYPERTGITNDLVLQQRDGSQWLARVESGVVRYSALTDLDELGVVAAAAGGGGSSILVPGLLALAGGGVAAAAAGGGGDDRASGGNSSDGGGPTGGGSTGGGMTGGGNNGGVDTTAPAAPTGSIAANGTELRGSGEAGATVTVSDPNGSVIGTAVVRPDGSFAVTLDPPRVAGGTLTVVQADAAGNMSAAVIVTVPDIAAPDAPTLAIATDGIVATGSGEPGATVTITDPAGSVVGRATVAANGTYSVPLNPPQIAGEVLTARQTDAAGNASAPATATAPDYVAPAAPGAVIDAAGAVVSGTGERGAAIRIVATADGTTLGSGVVGADGRYSVTLTTAQRDGEGLAVTQVDGGGNVSPATAIVAPDLTAPGVPVATIDATGTIIGGGVEAGATVTVRDANNAMLGTVIANRQGDFAIVLNPPQLDSQVLAVTQTDEAGNVSPPLALVAPDLTPPPAPAATVAADGSTVAGTGEAGATVIVTDPLGAEVGRGAVAADGSFLVAVAPPQVDGERLVVTQTDAAGNISPDAIVTAPDLLAGDRPDAPTATVSTDGAVVRGDAVPGAAIIVTGADGAVLARGAADANGAYALTLSPAQTNGETVRVVQADAEGDVSPPAIALAPDLTPPAAPTATLDQTGAVVTGTGEPRATIIVSAADGSVLGSATVNARGNYVVVLDDPQINGELLSARQMDGAGNASPAIPLVAPDFTVPLAPVATIAADGTAVSGTGEPGARLTVVDASGTVLGTATVAPDGRFTVPLTPPQTNGQALDVTQADAAGNVSPAVDLVAPDLTAPAVPTIAISADGTIASGTGEIGAAITITGPGGTVLGTTVVSAAGSWSVTLASAQINGELVTATQRDAAANTSPPASATAPDFVDPAAPQGVVSADGRIVTGTGEAGATLVVTDPGGTPIGVATVATDGRFTAVLNVPQVDGQQLGLVQTDAAGNASLPGSTFAPDLTAPAAPAGQVVDNGNTLTGTGEPGAAITVTNPAGVVIGTATVRSDGSFSAALATPQRNGETLGLVQRDGAGNPSPQVPVIAPDLVAPGQPVAAVAPDGATVTGTGEAGATIAVTGAGGAFLGSAVVLADGSFTVPLTPTQNNGQQLSVVQSDPAGNAASPLPLTAPDLVAPLAPTALVSADGAVVAGRGEPGATVTITAPGGGAIGSATVATDGSYSATLTTPQRNGEVLAVTQSDGPNTSPATPATAPDLTAPTAPTATVSVTGTLVTGIGEPGAIVSVRNAADVVIATATVGANGNYAASLNPPVIDGQVLTVTQRDTANNVSAQVDARAPDSTAPNVPTATVAADGGTVTGTGVAGSTITVTDPDGTTIGTAQVGQGGTYTVTLTPPQRDGELLQVTQADGNGNASPPVPALAPDLTAPAAPTAIVSSDGAFVSGSGEPGAQVRVTDAAGVQVGVAEVGADGRYVATLAPAQANGGTLTVVQADDFNNVSPGIALAAPDITAPPAPTALAVSADGGIVTGQGEIGARVEVRGPGGVLIGSGIVDGNGGFAVAIAPAQTTAATLNLTQTDAAGNVSPGATVVAPFDIDAFDNAATAIVDLVPATSNVALGSANYVALVSLGLINLQAEVLGVPAIRFEVEAGRSLAASFTYDALLNIGAASGYGVVVQRFDGANWVAVSGSGNGSLLELGLLGGNLVATEALGPGEYRAFLTFQGAAGVGLLGSLSVAGALTDYTDVVGVVPMAAQGNVITDPGAGGQVDVVSAQTSVQSVTVNGVTTLVAADDTVVAGSWGTLTIDRDGSYTYTPAADAQAIGRTETFQYTLVDGSDGELESATLTIAIASPDLLGPAVAVNDAATATATFANVVETVAPAVDFRFDTAGTVLVPQTGRGSDTFTVAAGDTSDVTITAVRTGLLSILPSYTITVRDAAGTVVGATQQTAVAGLSVGTLVATGTSFTLQDLPAGTYTYSVSSTNIVGTPYSTAVYLGQSITHTDEYLVSSTTTATGNLLANDDLAGSFAAIRIGSGGALTEVGDAPLTLNGRYGALTVTEAGDYVYRPSATLGYSPTDLVDSFTYELVQPNGHVSTATLNVTVDVPGDGAAAPAALSFAFAVDAVPLGEIDQATRIDADVTPQDVALGRFAYSMFEGQGELEAVLDRYLAEPDTAPTGGTAASIDHSLAISPDNGPAFDYLVMPGDLQDERSHQLSAI